MAEKRARDNKDEEVRWNNFATNMKNKRMKQTKAKRSKEKDIVGIGENILSERK